MLTTVVGLDQKCEKKVNSQYSATGMKVSQVSKSINTSSVAPYYIDGQLRAQKRHVYTHDSDFWKKLPVDFKQNIGS
jgi:hypothetical protein